MGRERDVPLPTITRHRPLRVADVLQSRVLWGVAVFKKPPAKSAHRLHVSMCKQCGGTGWVCENHRDRPWGAVSHRPDACECGAGAPCGICNTSEPPEVRWDSPRRA